MRRSRAFLLLLFVAGALTRSASLSAAGADDAVILSAGQMQPAQAPGGGVLPQPQTPSGKADTSAPLALPLFQSQPIVPVPESADPEDDSIKTDRPTFTPSSATVGKDHIQLETGYTFTRDRRDGLTIDTLTYPEANLRFGLFADWIEGRIEQNVRTVNSSSVFATSSQTGAEDLTLGVKLALTKQQGWVPESALILQTSVPTGSPFLTQHLIEPGFIYIFSWDVIRNQLSVSGSILANELRDGFDHTYAEFGHSLVVSTPLTRQADVFAEWYALYPSGASDPQIGPRQFIDVGLVYRMTRNCQIDWRLGVGLNNHSDDFYTGLGLSLRY